MKQHIASYCTRMAWVIFLLLCASHAYADDGYDLWLKYGAVPDSILPAYQRAVSSFYVAGDNPTCAAIRDELNRGLNGLLVRDCPHASQAEEADLIVGRPAQLAVLMPLINEDKVASVADDGFWLSSILLNDRKKILITAKTDAGLLYGTFHFLRLLQTGQPLDAIDVISNPKIQYRLLNHWDNLDGSVERGYAGKSLWKWAELPGTIDPRYRDYARANASIGINCTVLNNVNANPQILKPEYLRKVTVLADVFRPYGIRVFLSINFSSPISAEFALERNRRGGIGDLPTSDPLDPAVREWWKNKAAEIYALVPDFGGFLVKANSEGMPGPQDYHRTHADGANMLAEALAPFGGIVMWRAFVYDADVDPDRAKRAYLEFVPLDGQFLPNVFVQAKNGPIDFQPREPVQPLFGALPRTPLMLELQITQEYLGHSTHLVYLAPMWKEYLDFDTYAGGPGSTLAKIIDGSLHNYAKTGVTGVTNIGDDRNWCGHFFAQANWYAFGRLAWDHQMSADQIAGEWLRMSLTNNDNVVDSLRNMMLGSWEACVNYMTPLGLHHIMQEGFHYGPQPSLARSGRTDWTSVYYHRADSLGIGYDRSLTGSGFTAQYFSPLKEQFNDVRTCPEKYLLWFHHMPWDYRMASGKTLWEELCLHYYAGTDYADSMVKTWEELQPFIDPEVFQHVEQKLQQQQKDSKIWRDTCLRYFQQFSRLPIKE